MLDSFKSCYQFMCDITADKIGTAVAATGIVTEYMALIVIMLGVILWMFKYTKVFRWGIVFYLIGFFLEILGTSLII